MVCIQDNFQNIYSMYDYVLTLTGPYGLMTWAKVISVEPDLNQRPMDISDGLYSPPLYQLSYRRLIVAPHLVIYIPYTTQIQD